MGVQMNFPDWLLGSLRDPQTNESLDLKNPNLFISSHGEYPIINGIPTLVYPPMLDGMDLQMSQLYRWLAPVYDWSERFFGKIIAGQDMHEGRAEIVRLLNLQKGSRLLEVSPGPGVFQTLLRSAIGENGDLVSVDLSRSMLRECQRIQGETKAHLIQGNGAHLPFADCTFDALFHFGGVNLFSEPERALAEFVRVVKPMGIVAYGDEGFASDYPEGFRRKMMVRVNPGFRKDPPHLPSGLQQVNQHVVYGGLGYLVVGRRQEITV
jgi:ubiquinone/menaquinone biosynthesis C-methylase UbiE